VRIDHVIYATADLETGTARIAGELGFGPAGGGRHDGHGTHNTIFPLGGGYLEVLAVADAGEAAGSPLGRSILAADEGLLGWAVLVEDIEPLAARLQTPVVELTRAGLSARLTGVGEAMAEPWLPFFIERSADSADPGDGGSAGGITWLEIGGDADRLDGWLGAAILPVRVVGGAERLQAVGIGDRELRCG
jgi:hypothetical protein